MRNAGRKCEYNLPEAGQDGVNSIRAAYGRNDNYTGLKRGPQD